MAFSMDVELSLIYKTFDQSIRRNTYFLIDDLVLSVNPCSWPTGSRRTRFCQVELPD